MFSLVFKAVLNLNFKPLYIMRSITPFHRLRLNSLLNADSSGRKADILEALIIQASNEYIKVMKDIGNDQSYALRRDLAHSIQHPDLWEKNQLENRYRSI